MASRTNRFPPKTLVNLQEVKVYAATFVDGLSKADTRLVIKIGNNIHFLHQEGVEAKLKMPAGWLIKAIREKIGPVNAETESLPRDEVDLEGII
jgi:hypothetical protein